MIKALVSLTKPGIIFGNLMTASAGFILASRGNIDYYLFFMTLSAIGLIIASGCVFNNYIDRDIDWIMERTKNRALVMGVVSPNIALIYGICLGLLGVLILYVYTNILALVIALIGLFVYVVIYTIYLKRNSIYGTNVGSISGAVPPVIGYCAVTNNFDGGACILFMMLSLWQVPHSLAIAIYRLNDYIKASIPVLPAKCGVYITKIHMLIHILLFLIVALLLVWFQYVGSIYFIVVLLMASIWIYLCMKGFSVKISDAIWARQMFVFSIFYLMAICISLLIDFKK